MADLPAPTDMVMVAIMPKPRDMEIARVLGWYRIPLRSAPYIVAVDYLAFYQPATFGDDHKWKIEYIAPVLGHELVTRAELFKEDVDTPKGLEEYYKMQVGSLILLPTPVVAEKWKRLSFLYTTGERLLNSEILNQLTIQNEERATYWQALRERGKQYQHYQVAKLLELPPEADLTALFTLMGGGNPFDE
ncbi:MAG: hypothetical protein N2D54_01820 [Chloroflexota bacterium]